jgi:hypothetical protein
MNTAGEIKEKFKMVLMEFHETALPELVERKGLFDLSMLESKRFLRILAWISCA